MTRVCHTKVVTAVNGKVPGPTIHVTEGDTLIIHAINNSPYPVSLHWHGVFQLRSCWMDGANMITQCPTKPKGSYTYKFTIAGQSGTLWWHAHVSMLRSTVYGALIIKPKGGYPYHKPYKEVPIIIGEWWNTDVIAMQNQASLLGVPANISDAFTINGKPGDLYNCTHETFELTVEHGKAYLLRIINAALNIGHFFKVAGHTFTVVGVDASYTNPYKTDVVVIAPGQTVDVIMVADAAPGNYYMAACAYASAGPPGPKGPFFNPTTTTAVVRYKYPHGGGYASASRPVMPDLPSYFDTATATAFHFNLTGLVAPQLRPTVPLHVDEHMFMAFGMGFAPCQPSQPLCDVNGVPLGAFAAHYNNISFQFPTKMSMAEAHYRGVKGVYTSDFPNEPPVLFDFVNVTLASNPPFVTTGVGTKVKRLRFNETVEMVLQNQASLGPESHPLHLHGYNFFILAQGFGNFNPAAVRYNLKNPLSRNTISTPPGGWAVIRFTATNPGVWLFHCHLDAHVEMGLAMAFEVEDGGTPESKLPPPPSDYPKC